MGGRSGRCSSRGSPVIRAAPAAASGVNPPVGAGSNPAGALAAGGVGNDPPLAAANVAGDDPADDTDDTGDEALPAAAVVSLGAADSVAGGLAGGAPDAGTSGTAASAAALTLLTAAVV